jgi:hypothetical protein
LRVDKGLDRVKRCFAGDSEKVTVPSAGSVATDAEPVQAGRPAALHPSRRRREPPRRAERQRRVMDGRKRTFTNI